MRIYARHKPKYNGTIVLRTILVSFLLLIFRCMCEQQLTVRTTFINTIGEDVLVRDTNFSRGIIPFFLHPKDTFTLSRTLIWQTESFNYLAPEEQNALSVLYNVYIAGRSNKFDSLYSSKLVEPFIDSTTHLYPEDNAVYTDTFRIQ
jgi:hypothetical protein